MTDYRDFMVPRFTDVMVRGNDAYGGCQKVIDNGHFKTLSVPVYSTKIGTVSNTSSGNMVNDVLGRKIGNLEGGIWGPHTLRRW